MNSTRFFLASFLVAGMLAAPPVRAAAPSLSVLQPTGFQRGTQVELTLTGARLGDALELMFYSPGFRVLELAAEAENRVKATLEIDENCRLGIHALRLRAASGLSNLLTFTVGVLPEIEEEEPNNDFASPQPVPLDVTISGVVENEDVDYFVIEAKQGERITVEVEGMRLGYTFFDPFVAILNEDRFTLARSDASALLRHDPLCAILAPEDGRYIIQLHESAFGGNASSRYRMHVGRFPRPTAVYPPGGRPGETLEVRWLGDPAGEWTEQVTLPSLEDPQYGLFASDEHGMAPSPNVIRVVDLENTLEVEPNDTREQATPATVPGALNGIIETPGDVDYFKFSAAEGQVFDLHVYAREPLRSPLDSVLTVYRSNGSVVGSNDDSGGPDSYLRFTAPEEGEYFVSIRDHLGRGGPDFVYRIEVTPVEPRLELSLPERRRFFSTTLVVHQGNRMALMVNAAREDWSGDLEVAFEDLPDGITARTVPMAGNRTTIPVLFTADADAPLNGTLADVIGRASGEDLDVQGRLQQYTPLIRGRNNVHVWGHDADRMASVVAEQVPFELEIVPTEAPIVRGGSKDLKVVAKRQDGFDQPIAITMLYNPPGIGSSGAITIAEGEDEAEIPLTANANAGIGTWPIVVTGSARVGNGDVEVATQMAELEVSQPYFAFAFERAAGELGGQAELIVNVENNLEFDGEAEVQLVGLPANTSTDGPKNITKDTEQIVFPISIAEDAAPGRFTSLVCQAVATTNGEPVVHTFPGGELRIDRPLPAAKPKPAAPAAEEPEPSEKPKRLSRLEQLRLQRMQQEQSQQ